MPLFNNTITLGVTADFTDFERQLLSATAKAQKNVKPLDLRLSNNISQPLGKITGDIGQFNKSIDAAAARVLAFTSTVAIVNGVVNSFRALVKETISVEKALTDINVVLNTNTKELDAFRGSLFDIARNTGQSFKVVSEAALELSRQGLGVQETLKRTNDALLLSRLSGLDAAEAVKTLTSAMNGFGKEALNTSKVVNTLANVDANFAVSTKDLAEALTRVGSTATDANVSFNELIATVTAVQQTTSRGGAVIGNALKTIFTRLGREGTIEQLRELGVAIDESQGGIAKLQTIADKIREVDATTANTIKELAGGVFQINIVSAALGDLSKEYSIYGNALIQANDQTAAAVIRNDALNKTLDALTKTGTANVAELLSKVGSISLGDKLRDLFVTFNDVTGFFIDSLDGDEIGATVGKGIVQGIGNFISGPAAILAVGTFLRLIAKVGSDAFAAFKQFSGITNSAEKLSMIQGAMTQKLERNTAYYVQQIAAGKTLEQVQRNILNDLAAEVTLRSTISRLAVPSSSSLLRAEGNKYTLKRGDLVRNAADGILPALTAESRAVRAGVGGASPSAKSVFIPRFNFGDRQGPIVVNTSEKIVENWMGGKGSAVLNKDMIKALGGESGLPAFGKVKNVSEGYVPNLTSFDVAGGKVNLKKRGSDVILDEILAGFDETGSRKQGTGIVRQAFDIAVEYGKKQGASGLVVDILNSKVAESLNKNPRFSSFGPFSRGKFRIPLMGMADGYVPSFNSGSNITSDALKSFSNPKELLKFISSTGVKANKGSSRIFIDVGGGKGLKVAFNKAGIAQNEKEFPILSQDYYARQQYGDILPQGYDFDEERGLYGFVEKLNPVGANKFKELAGKGKRVFGYNLDQSAEDSFGANVNNFLRDYNLRNDFGGGRNIGLSNDGKLKLMDIGFSDEIAEKFYRTRELGRFAGGYVPNLMSESIMKGAILGQGKFGTAYENKSLSGKKGLPDLVFKKFHKEGTNEVDKEFAWFKYMESLGLPVTKVFGSLKRSQQRNGIVKERAKGFSADLLRQDIDPEVMNTFKQDLQQQFKSKGVEALDLHTRNYSINDNKDELVSVFKKEGYNAFKNRALSKVSVFDGAFFPVTGGDADKFKQSYRSLLGGNKAGGFIPSLAMSPLREAISREASALIEQGFAPSDAKRSIRVDASPVLSGPKNPLGLGVFNTLQGQTSLQKAFADHGGQNLKTVGAARGYVPNLVDPIDEADVELRKNRITKTTTSASITPQLNAALSALSKTTNIDDYKAAAAEVQKFEKLLAKKTFDIVRQRTGQALADISRNENAYFKSTGGLVTKAESDRIKNTLSKVATNPSPTIATQLQKDVDDITKTLTTSSAEKVKRAYEENADKAGPLQYATIKSMEEIQSSASKAVASRGLLSPKGSGEILENTAGFDKLPRPEQDKLYKSLKKEAGQNRRQSFERAGLGLAFAGSLATPFLDQGAQAARDKGNVNGAEALSTASSAVTGASLGAAFGPIPALIGAVAGAAYGLADAFDQTDEKASKLTETFQKLSAENSATINGFSNYIQVQDKLNSVIEQGGKQSDIQALSQELSRVFASISSQEVRSSIIATGGSIESLTEALAKAQRNAFEAEKRAGVSVVAAQERDSLTTLGVRTNDTFSQKSLSTISQTLVSSAGKNLGEFSKSLQNIEGDLSLDAFKNSLKLVGIEAKQAEQFFEDLLSPINRLALVRNIKEEINIATQLEEMAKAAVLAKTSVTDLNRTLAAIVSIQAVNDKAALDSRSNRFSVAQNAAQNNASNRFFNAGDFGRQQLSAAFETQSVRFGAGQQRQETLNQLKAEIAGLITGNRTELQTDPELLKALTNLSTTGQGDLPALIERAFKNGVGSGRNEKVFVDIANVLNNSNNQLASIDDKAASQIAILQQNLSAARERIAIENRIGVLGGASGQIAFGRSGLEGFKDRDVNSVLGRRNDEVGVFGRGQNAQAILEFQRSLGGAEGLDVRTLIPNAEELVRSSIKENIIQGLGRVGVDITPSKIQEIDSVAELSAKNAFQKRELTADEIGKAVGSSFNYSEFGNASSSGFSTALTSTGLAANAGFVPEIYKVLQEKFGLSSEKAQQMKELESGRKSATSTDNAIKNSFEQIKGAERKFGVIGDGQIRKAFDNNIVKAVNKQDFQYVNTFTAASKVQTSERATEDTLNRLFNVKLTRDGGTSADLERRVNEQLKPSGITDNAEEKLFKEALRALLVNGGIDKDQKVTTKGLDQLLDILKSNNQLSVSTEGQSIIEQANADIANLNEDLQSFNDKVKVLTTSISVLDERIKAQDAAAASKPSLGGKSGLTFENFQNSTVPKFGDFPSRPAVGPFNTSFADGESVEIAAAKAAAIASAKARSDASNLTIAQNEALNTKFGPVDTNAINAFTKADGERNADSGNRFKQQAAREAEATLLRQAQLQQFNTGQVDPRLKQTLAGASNGTVTQRLSTKNAEINFDAIVSEANAAFTSGFASDAEMKKIGLKITEGLEDYARAQIKLGIPEAEVRAEGDRIRKTLEERLSKIQVKLATSKLEEFGQGFSSQLETLQKQYDDLGSLGAKTAADLTNGFGDAFFEVASGAQSARDAVGSMLSGVAADLSKFFAKRAFAQMFAMTAGNSSAGSFGELFGIKNSRAQGGIIKRAQGGSIPALVMGGERAFGPDVVSSLGSDFFKDLNAGKIDKFAGGGKIKGGSGYKDDVFGMFPEGSFILQKAAVNKYGPDYLDQIEASAKMAKGGKVQRAFWGALIGGVLGGALQGAAAGAVTAKITGGDWKKGALYGGITGGIAGGIGGASFAKSNPNAGFGGGFSNSFAWTGLTGNKSAAGPSAAGQPSAAGGVPSSLSPNGPSFGSTSGPSSLGNIADLNGGNATGLGNQSLTGAQTQAKPSIWKTSATNLGTSLALALASSALAPKVDKNGNKIIQGNGSVTTYMSDGSVSIASAGGNKIIKRTDYSSTSQLGSLVAANGGQLPAGGIQTLANGGEVGSGSGSVSYSDRAILNTINKTFPQGYALGGPITPAKQSGMFSMGGSMEEFSPAMNPYISVGSGTGDDVNIRAKKGEFMMTDRAVDTYGLDFMQRVNRMEIDPRDARQSGVIKMENGGPVEYSPADRDRGLFSLGNANGTPSTPAAVEAPRGGGGGDTNIDITININNDGTATVDAKAAGDKTEAAGSVDSAKFAAKVKAMFAELVETEKRPGGSLSKENM